MSIDVVSPLRQRMIEDMTGHQLGPHSQRSQIYSCKRFAACATNSLTKNGPPSGRCCRTSGAAIALAQSCWGLSVASAWMPGQAGMTPYTLVLDGPLRGRSRLG